MITKFTAGIGKRLRELRLANGFTQKYVAKKLKCFEQHIQRLERGYCAPSVDWLIKCADFYNVTTDYILGRGK